MVLLHSLPGPMGTQQVLGIHPIRSQFAQPACDPACDNCSRSDYGGSWPTGMLFCDEARRGVGLILRRSECTSKATACVHCCQVTSNACNRHVVKSAKHIFLDLLCALSCSRFSCPICLDPSAQTLRCLHVTALRLCWTVPCRCFLFWQAH